ncbi:MAG: hypothetical protein KGL35_15040 [Bradyrhizobium sp.]|uniref:hypothetical protein n=1 Tax=Bradyrhizobium sp. TaxID=376 RepID=UPI00239D20C3|nr:hypothetical protein [Bradyrhizobium sp.]MDE2069527.1 hypothetical protein [Bradyrhizobium sp.]MDE2470013.1 hypothetical protein [Bradyrhizobium sp.]
MNLRVLAVAALLALGGTMTAANAVEFNAGPGGVDVGPGYHHDRYYRDHDHYYRDYGNSCRTVIDHRTNRYGDDVTVHRRVCD